MKTFMRFVLCTTLAGTACGGDDGHDEKQSSDGGDERGSKPDAGFDGGQSRSDAMRDAGSSSETTTDAGMGDAGMSLRDAFDIALCTHRPNDSACVACTKEKCCEPLAACAKNLQCTTVLDCFTACDNQPCRTACITMYPGGYEASQAIPLCNKSKCADVCK